MWFLRHPYEVPPVRESWKKVRKCCDVSLPQVDRSSHVRGRVNQACSVCALAVDPSTRRRNCSRTGRSRMLICLVEGIGSLRKAAGKGHRIWLSTFFFNLAQVQRGTAAVFSELLVELNEPEEELFKWIRQG